MSPCASCGFPLLLCRESVGVKFCGFFILPCIRLYPEGGIATWLCCRLLGLLPGGNGPRHGHLLFWRRPVADCLISPPRKGERLRVSTTYSVLWHYCLRTKFGAPYGMWNHVIRCAKYVFIHFVRSCRPLTHQFYFLCTDGLVNKLPILNNTSYILWVAPPDILHIIHL